MISRTVEKLTFALVTVIPTHLDGVIDYSLHSNQYTGHFTEVILEMVKKMHDTYLFLSKIDKNQTQLRAQRKSEK